MKEAAKYTFEAIGDPSAATIKSTKIRTNKTTEVIGRIHHTQPTLSPRVLGSPSL